MKHEWSTETEEVEFAAREAAALLTGDVDLYFRSSPPNPAEIEKRESLWFELIGKYSPPIREKIMQLREALRRGATESYRYQKELAVLKGEFAGIESGIVQILLPGILYGRITGSSGQINPFVDINAEAVAMKDELSGPLSTRSSRGLTFQQTIQAALAGSLKLTWQTKPRSTPR